MARPTRIGLRTKPRLCIEDGCSRTTREGKPFCTEHVEMHPYVQEILGYLDAREQEEQRIAKYGASAVEMGSPVMREIMVCILNHGELTLARLVREVPFSSAVVRACVHCLARAGKIKTGSTKRSSIKVSII